MTFAPRPNHKCYRCYGSGIVPAYGNFIECPECFPQLPVITSDNTGPNLDLAISNALKSSVKDLGEIQ